MDLVIFGFVIEHVSRINRILKQPSGHALLIGIGGTGRTSAAKIATYIADYELFQIEMSKKYTFIEWRADLKALLRKAGEKGVNTVFLFADHQVKEISFLEDINMLLNTADIPSLFENEEKLEIIEKVGKFSCELSIKINLFSRCNKYNKLKILRQMLQHLDYIINLLNVFVYTYILY
jgi:dynein heavy chain